MPNEEIVSALRNAIDHGESLQSAVQIMINSGYNSEEVQEASKFIGGTLSLQEPMPEEQLTMPEEKKSFSSKLKLWGKKENQTPVIQQPLQKPTQAIPQTLQQISSQSRPQYSQYPLQQSQKIPQQYSPQITQEQIRQSFQQPQRTSQQIPQAMQQQAYQYQQKPTQTITQRIPHPISQYSHQPISKKGELSREIEKIKPAGQGYAKEIILLIILLILIGILAATIFFKDKILGWFG